ncbi:TOM1-like protein 2 isoform X2 [Diadema antillarum]|uniref:TOM1-like protein 2 isoform X2 n=1 Tax=Diadema antillarum TaxID=105358 RepID=UPI003A89F0C1
MSFMRTNPFTSPVGQRIERATSESQASEDWGLIMEITDIINETDEGAKDAIKALKKRLFGNKKWKEVMFSLTVLETCVKNCQHRFHVLVCKQEFCKELVKVIQPSQNPPTIVQEKILSLIQSWADAFKSDTSLHGVVKVYEELKSKSIEFPPTDLDTLSPIRTPQRMTPEVDPAMSRPPPTRQPTQPAPPAMAPGQYPTQAPGQYPPQAPGQYPPQAPSQYPPQAPGQYPPQAPSQYPPQAPQNAAPTSAGGMGGNQMTKLRRDLDLVLGNIRVMSEMLTEMTPGQESQDDLELLQELNQTCRVMQQRVVELLSEVSHEEVTGELLRINDDLNNLFVRYDRYERYRTSQSQSQGVPPPQPTAVTQPLPPAMPVAQPVHARSPPPEENTGTLIDFGVDEPVAPVAAPAVHAAPPMGGVMPPAPPYDGLPYPELGPNPAPAPASGLADQLAGLSMTGGSVSNTLGQIGNVPTSVNPPPPEDDFDMFAQSRQTTYQDSRRSGSTYQDNTNVDQAGGALAGFVQNRANPYPPPTQPTAAPTAATTGRSGLDDVEQWLTASDLSKEQDDYAAANTNAADGGITSSEFDKFLQERAKAADTLRAADNVGTHSNVMAPASSSQNRQMQMNETENNMFAL